MTAYLHAILDAITQNPHWVGAFVFLTAFAESVAIIGTVFPGTTIMIAVGAAVGLGQLPLWPMMIYATLGAIAGDGVSYWLGHRYQHHIRAVWPFSKRPELLATGEAFFARHGAKSVVLARFTPFFRAIIPLVAGMMGVPPLRFYVANVVSALLWAPAHILPGAVLGLSLSMVGAISGRLVAALAVVAVFVVLAVWLLRFSLLRIVPVLGRSLRALVARLRRWDHPVARFILAILDPDRPGTRALLVLGFIFLASIIGFAAIAEDVISREEIVLMDVSVSNFVQGLRTSWGDAVMVVITSFGDGVVTAVVAFVAIAWLASRRAWPLALGLATALVFAALFVPLLKAAIAVPRPVDLYSGAEAFGFPSGHATFAATLYGCLAWLIGSGLSRGRRILVLAIAATIVAMIAASRIYLGAHWPSDIAAGLLFGFALASLYGLVFWRIDLSTIHPGPLGDVAMIALLVFGSWHAWTSFDQALTTYAPAPRELRSMADSAWRAQGWRRPPAHRIDLRGETEEPFALQWAGPLAALEQALTDQGWQRTPAVTIAGLAGFLSIATPLRDLPVLPTLHSGHAPALTMVQNDGEADRRIVLRVWLSNFAVIMPASGTPTPLYLGSLVGESPRQRWGLVTTIDHLADQNDLVGAIEPALAVRPDLWIATRQNGNRTLLLASPAANVAPSMRPPALASPPPSAPG